MSGTDLDAVQLINALPEPCVLLTSDFVVREANAAYLAATHFSRADLVNRTLLEAVPDRGDEATAAVRAVQADLVEVVRTKVSRTSVISRYDLPTGAGGRLQRRYWSSVNSPVLDSNGQVQYLVIRALDVTCARTAVGRAVSRVVDQLAFDDGALDVDLQKIAGYFGDSRGDSTASDPERQELSGQISELLGVFEARMIIEQAKGFFMARCNISADHAFAQMRAQSQHTNVKLREVAAAIVASSMVAPVLSSRVERTPAPRRPQ